jgi:hypothetical protein
VVNPLSRTRTIGAPKAAFSSTVIADAFPYSHQTTTAVVPLLATATCRF